MKTTATKRDKFQYATIRFVNRVRRDLGLKPIEKLRRGKIGKPWACPITNSVKGGRSWLEVSTGADSLAVNDFRKLIVGSHYVLPTLVESFVDRFDEGLYPTLVAK